MIKITRAIACDGIDCRAMSLDVLRTIDVDESKSEVPDWQGWQVIPPDPNIVPGGYAFNPDYTKPRHLCPKCVATGNPVEPPPLPVPV